MSNARNANARRHAIEHSEIPGIPVRCIPSVRASIAPAHVLPRARTTHPVLTRSRCSHAHPHALTCSCAVIRGRTTEGRAGTHARACSGATHARSTSARTRVHHVRSRSDHDALCSSVHSFAHVCSPVLAPFPPSPLTLPFPFKSDIATHNDPAMRERSDVPSIPNIHVSPGQRHDHCKLRHPGHAL